MLPILTYELLTSCYIYKIKTDTAEKLNVIEQSHCSKNQVLLERIIFRQHGHRKGYSNESQLACFIEDLSQFTRSGAQVDCLKIDLKSATSYVNHEILLARLKNLFVDRTIYRYLRRFLKEHTQSVKVGCCTSEKRPLKQGLPQGSPLTNPLFLIYIDHIFDIMKNRSRIRCFGDDILAYKMVVSRDNQYALQEDVYHIQQYFEDNGLQVR
jgi:Reverse transcriptase (RNA-dependent DNA polymerase)